MTAPTSPVSHPEAWLLSSPPYWNRLLESHQMAWWVPNPVPHRSQHCSISQQGPPSLHPFLGVCRLLLCPVLSAPHSPGLALLLLTSESWCPLQVSAQLLCLSTVPSLSVRLHSFPGFHLSCLRMAIKSAPSSHASHLHTQLLFSLQVCSNGVSQRLPKFSAPKESPPVCLDPIASSIILSSSTHETIQRHLWVLLSLLLLPAYPAMISPEMTFQITTPPSSFWQLLPGPIPLNWNTNKKAIQ